jgi:phosphatidylinositol glycan class O
MNITIMPVLKIAHFLGVDHVGHRYKVDHPAMATKLTEMNGVLEELIAALPDDTMLLVMGDHGLYIVYHPLYPCS